MNMSDVIAPVEKAIDKYLIWIKIAGLIAVVLITVWICKAFFERDKYQEQAKLWKDQTNLITKQFNEYIELHKDIAAAVQKVQVKRDVYIEYVENQPKPETPAGAVLPFITPRMPEPTGLPGYQNYSANRADPATP